jgi:hypothetical protein
VDLKSEVLYGAFGTPREYFRMYSLLLIIFFPCREIFHRIDHFLDDNGIKAILMEENSSE